MRFLGSEQREPVDVNLILRNPCVIWGFLCSEQRELVNVNPTLRNAREIGKSNSQSVIFNRRTFRIQAACAENINQNLA